MTLKFEHPKRQGCRNKKIENLPENLNEDRSILAKCRPMIPVSGNINSSICRMRIFGRKWDLFHYAADAMLNSMSDIIL